MCYVCKELIEQIEDAHEAGFEMQNEKDAYEPEEFQAMIKSHTEKYNALCERYDAHVKQFHPDEYEGD